EIGEAAWVYQRQIDRGEKTVVGVNRYQVPEERPPELLRVPLEVEARQADRVRRVKRERNATAAREALGRVRDAARSSENLMPPLIAAVAALIGGGQVGCRAGRARGCLRGGLRAAPRPGGAPRPRRARGGPPPPPPPPPPPLGAENPPPARWAPRVSSSSPPASPSRGR